MLYTQINGGPLLTRIQEHVRFSEHEAAQIIKEIASGLDFLHKKGIAHRDLKPENILCVSKEKLCPIKICDFDLGSGINFTTELSSPSATPLLLTPVSVKVQFIIELLVSNKQTRTNQFHLVVNLILYKPKREREKKDSMLHFVNFQNEDTANIE